ncbi:MAG: class I mannose-6-phosphate isomerase [Sphingomonas sp.]|uniref:type I phosphomannose isomerase catalytic subunit n=1 Tax=Sphingomonas sp. TaxID=28214 RepID=UPI0017EB4654|nr:type I phosphomannose isomerase catalytic subunit [Sphingomonas sp.]MBA3667819.1 class I mannose-6-phosphate isomerase [Sphingomonas sp.]
MLLNTVEVEKPWGVDKLPQGFDYPGGKKIGEIWFDRPGDPLPLLIKWLFTSERLSIQVHPNDEQANDRGLKSGKEECWAIVAAEPGAKLGIGTIRPLSLDELREASLNGKIENLMDWKPVRAGDFFYIPAGTVHAIGAGISLIEVQQNADVTYRLYDYGRPRELHLDDGVAVSRPEPYADPRSGRMATAGLQQLVDGPLFRLWQGGGAEVASLIAASDEPSWLIPVEGKIETGDGERAGPGDCLYLQPGAKIAASESSRMLVARNGTV